MSVTTNNHTAADGTATPHRSQSKDRGLLAGNRRAVTGPQRPRNRSWGLVTLAALLVLGLGLAVAAWGIQVGEKTSVLAVGTPVAEGQVLERGDLVSTSVAGVSGAIPIAQIDTVVGKTTAVDLVPGQILTAAMMADDPVPGPGQSVVGLALDPTRVPSAGLRPGDLVDVIAVPSGEGAETDPATLEAPEVLDEAAEVYAVGGAPTPGGQVLLTLVVDADTAAKLAAYSTQNRVAVVETAPTTGAGS